MTEESYQSFARSHDPDDVASRNIDIGGLLRRVKGAYAGAELLLDESNTDSALIISAIAYDTTSQVLSFRITGGTRAAQHLGSDGVTMAEGYLIRCRVTLTDGRRYDQSYVQTIRQH